MPSERSEAAEWIGPYRILERLGAGGMGEVFLAYDDRLDRHVAIKRVRPGAGDRPERRERFRREARMAAGLSHPAIVHVYDILQEGDTDSIVMEHIEGESLRELIEPGPLDILKVLEMARELADGLDAAHRQGIVHRDLKSENILVTRAGRPKIADFGIAKRLAGESTGREEESLTADHLVVGTYRSMSPEQARGEPVDHRTDLFSFGVLLYEALTGNSPFGAENGLATLNRVIHLRQKPLAEVRPGVPPALSDLVDHLLEKDPRLRPRSAGEVRRELDRLALATADGGETMGTETLFEIPTPTPSTPSSAGGAGRPLTGAPPAPPSVPPSPSVQPAAEPAAAPVRPPARPARRRLLAATAAVAVLGLGALGIWAYLALRRPVPPLYVAVLAPEVGGAAASAGDTGLLASGVRMALLQGLASLEGISPLGFEEVDAAPGTPREVARAVAADEVLATRLDCRPEACQVALTRRRGSDGSVVWAESLALPTDDSAVMASAVRAQIQHGYAGHDVRRGMLESAAGKGDFDELLRLRQRFEAGRDQSPEPLLAGLERLRGRSPRFLEAYLLEAQVLRSRFWASRDARDLARAQQLVGEARELAPGDPRPLFESVDLALEAGHLDAAERDIGELASLVPGDARLLERQARLAGARGRGEEALSRMRSAARLQPSARRLHNLAQMELRQGDAAAARKSLELLLTRSPHNYDGLSLLAQIELSSGDLGRAVALYRELVRISPGLAELSNLGLAYFLEVRYAEAAAAFSRAYEQQPGYAALALNLADAYSMLGKTAEAEALYRRTIALVEGDPSATGPQFWTVKAQALAHLRQGPQAVAALSEAQRLAPEDGQVAFESSLVYALLGEPSSAVASAGKAVRLGVERRWFTLPWFDPLEQRADFQELLRPPPPT